MSVLPWSCVAPTHESKGPDTRCAASIRHAELDVCIRVEAAHVARQPSHDEEQQPQDCPQPRATCKPRPRFGIATEPCDSKIQGLSRFMGHVQLLNISAASNLGAPGGFQNQAPLSGSSYNKDHDILESYRIYGDPHLYLLSNT